MNLSEFLWKIAGANVDILEECKTDQVRFANIGAVILATSCIAFCSGCFAAYYFTCNADNPNGNIIGAIAFGVIWSMLIFCIDRALVVTLQKKENGTKTWWIMPFFSRLLLGTLIASMISIPVELFLFKDYITQTYPKYVSYINSVHQSNYMDNASINNFNQLREDYSSGKKTLVEDRDKLLSAIKQKSDSIIFIEKEIKDPLKFSKECERYYNSYKSLETEFNEIANKEKKKKKKSKEYNEAEIKRNKAKRIYEDYTYKWKLDKNKEANSKRNELNQLTCSIDVITQKINQTDSLLQNVNGNIQTMLNERIESGKSIKSAIDKGNSFVRNFIVLEWGISTKNMENKGDISTEGVFLWLIRLLFLLIEMLPTVVKIATPVGSYDRKYWKMVKAETEDFDPERIKNRKKNKDKNDYNNIVINQEQPDKDEL